MAHIHIGKYGFDSKCIDTDLISDDCYRKALEIGLASLYRSKTELYFKAHIQQAFVDSKPVKPIPNMDRAKQIANRTKAKTRP